MKILDIDTHNVVLIDIISLIQNCELNIVKDLEQFSLIDDTGSNFRKKDVKTIFYFYILKSICDAVINSPSKNKCVFYYNKGCLCESDLIIFKRCDTSKWKFSQFILTFIKKLNNILPNLFYIADNNHACIDLIDTTTGEGKELISSIKSNILIKNKKIFTFEKAKNFIKEYGLTYLDEQYFNKVKIKSLVYK